MNENNFFNKLIDEYPVYRTSIDNTSITHLYYDYRIWDIERINDIDHLR